MSSTEHSRESAPTSWTDRRVRRGTVTHRAILMVEWDQRVDAAGASEEECCEIARRCVMSGPAREEWDLVSLSMARALRRHLATIDGITRLIVARQTGEERPELLIRICDGD